MSAGPAAPDPILTIFETVLRCRLQRVAARETAACSTSVLRAWCSDGERGEQADGRPAADVDPDMTRGLVRELGDRGIETSYGAVWRLVRGAGLRFKKKPARERTGAGRRGAETRMDKLDLHRRDLGHQHDAAQRAPRRPAESAPRPLTLNTSTPPASSTNGILHRGSSNPRARRHHGQPRRPQGRPFATPSAPPAQLAALSSSFFAKLKARATGLWRRPSRPSEHHLLRPGVTSPRAGSNAARSTSWLAPDRQRLDHHP